MVTAFDGRTNAVAIAANTQVVLAPAVAVITSPTVAEYNAGEAVETSIKSVNVSGSVATNTEIYLTDTDEAQVTGATTWSVDPIELTAGDPQTPNTWLDGLTEGQVVYLIIRRGLPYTTAAAAAQKVSVTKCEITLIEDGAATANANGDKYTVMLHLAVKQHVRNVALSV